LNLNESTDGVGPTRTIESGSMNAKSDEISTRERAAVLKLPVPVKTTSPPISTASTIIAA